jgi:PAS domain-containing protein
MPEVVGFRNPELPAKRRVIKLMKQQYHDDRSLGTTAPVGDQVDNLLESLEELESLATVLVSHLETQDMNKVPVTSDQIVRFYVIVRRTLFNTKKLEFSKTPRLDIDSITSYLSSLKDLYSSLEELFELNKMSIAKQFPKRGNKPVTDPAFLAQYDDRLEQDLENERFAIEDYLEELEGRIRVALEDRQRLIETKELTRGLPALPPAVAYRAKRLFEKSLADVDAQIEEMQGRKEAVEQQLLQLKQDILEQEQYPRGEDQASIIKAISELSALSHPEKLVLQQFKILLDTLQTGIVIFNAGLTGRVNKVSDMNREGYAVDVPDVVGAGRYSLHSVHQDSMHRRFL